MSPLHLISPLTNLLPGPWDYYRQMGIKIQTPSEVPVAHRKFSGEAGGGEMLLSGFDVGGPAQGCVYSASRLSPGIVMESMQEAVVFSALLPRRWEY